jgi:signal peptidase I
VGPEAHRAPALSRRAKTLIALAVLIAGALLFVRLVVAEPFRIVSASMVPTLEEGDSVLVDKLAYGDDGPRRGELIVFEAPRTGDVTLKRVVGVGGDRVAIEDGLLVVNGRRPDEPYTDPDAIDSVYFGPVRVPAGSVFVLGDNRRDSADSRRFGAVPVDDVIGRVRARIWPPGRWGQPH